MASNYVEIKVKASDEAKPDLEALKFDLESIGHKVETARIDVEDKDASAKLLALNARLADLNRKVSNPRLSASGAAKVEADIAAVDAALDRLNDKHAKPEVTLKGAAETLAEVEALDHELNKLEDKANTASSGGGVIEKILGSGIGPLPLPAIAALVPVVGALLVEVTGLASGFAAAGAGAGAFALLAKPAVTQVTTAYQGLHAAQQKYQSALALEKLDPSKSHASAVTAATDQLKLAQQAIGKLPASEQEAIKGLSGLSAEFGKMSKAFEPKAFQVFAAGLGLVKKLLPDIVPFANTFANVLTKLLGQASKFAGSKGFSDFLKQFHGIEGPALNSIGQGIGKVTVAIGKLLTTMSGKDVAHAINIAFDGIAGTINGVAQAVKFLMQFWDGAVIAITTGAHTIASRFDEIRHDAASWADAVGHAVAQVVVFFVTLPAKIVSALGNLGSLLVHAGESIMDGLLHGIMAGFGKVASFVSGIASKIASLKGPLDYDAVLLVPHGRAIMQGLMNGIGSRMPDLAAQLGGVSRMISGMPGGGPGGRGGGPMQLQVMPGGGSAFEQFMVQAMRNYVRVRGGDVQSVLGH